MSVKAIIVIAVVVLILAAIVVLQIKGRKNR